MSEHPTGPLETGAKMDYPEHEKTYDVFIAGAKYVTVILVALMMSMAAGFFTAAGFFGGIILFVILSIAGVIMFR